jgi:hypothetical protein
MESGLLYVKDPNWRSTWPDGAWPSDKAFGDATSTLEGIDPEDGNLSDPEHEPLVLTGIGSKGIACFKAQVTLLPVIEPLVALGTCLHVSGTVLIISGQQLTVVGSPLSTNSQLDYAGTIEGDAEAATVGTTGTITGTLTVRADAKPMPDPSVISQYINRATEIPFPGNIISNHVLTATSSPWGPVDPNGVYFIDAGVNDLTIKNSRIHATLVIRAASGNRVLIEDAVFMQSYRIDPPAVIIDSELELRHRSGKYALSEAICAANFNPIGAPYEGEDDADMLDENPNEVRGLLPAAGSRL